jgi:hypothetical protein
MNALRSKLMSLVEMSKTNPNAVEYLCEMLRKAEEDHDRNTAAMIRLALRHATK